MQMKEIDEKEWPSVVAVYFAISLDDVAYIMKALFKQSCADRL